MSENAARHLAVDPATETMAPVLSNNQHQNYDGNVDYVINEYMERLGTRLNILETELKYAWRALDLLSQEYIKMWERLEKLEGLLYDQQSVISQLLDFYTNSAASYKTGMGASAVLDGRLGELEVIREILGNGNVEDGLEEGLDVSRNAGNIQELVDDMHVPDPDEAFYRSLNQAYREDLVGVDQNNQLGLIWEEREENEDNDKKIMDDSEEVYSALDYKDYRGNSPCVSEQDIAQLSRIDSIDHVAIEKLNELDRLSSKLQQDSDNIKQLQRKLLESPISSTIVEEQADANWSFSSANRDQEEMMLIANSDLPNSLPFSTRPSSRLSVTDSVIGNDNEVAEVLGAGGRTPTSPRRRQDVTTCSEPFTTVTGRLAYSAAVQHVDAALNPKNPFYNPSLFENQSTPHFNSKSSEKASSPTLSICSIRTRQDGYIGPTADQSSPPPPAPGPTVFLGAEASSSINEIPPKPKSPKSPKRKSLVAAKSDSGLSSMSGWSSLEKSPCSPSKNNLKIATLNYFNNDSKLATDNNSSVPSSSILPGGHHLSAFTTVKSPCSLETSEGYGTFVPAPAPASDINISPRRKHKEKAQSFGEFMFRNDQPIYSVAGSNRDSYTSVYTSNSADYISQTNYPDLVEPYYENNELLKYDNVETTSQDYVNSKRKSFSRSYSTTTNGADFANHEGYKTAMYRTMFPSGNITDALSYYPTSSRYELPQYGGWVSYPTEKDFEDNKNQLYYPNHQQQPQQQQLLTPQHQQQQQAQQQQVQQQQTQQQQQQQQPQRYQRENQPFLELDLRNRNVPEFHQHQHPQDVDNKYYDSSNVIITQSGYISITNEEKDESKKQFKMKRGNTLKSAMNSVSHWFPDLHLKRNRSHSLPSNCRSDLEKRNFRSHMGGQKKKRNPIVSTVSGILQKAKRKTHNHTQSLSDPEQSENEWVINRGGSSSVVSEDEQSEDSFSVFSDTQQTQEMLFAKVPPKKKEESEEPPVPSPPLPPPLPKPVPVTERAEEIIEEVPPDTVIADAKMVVVVGGASMEFAVSRALGKYRQRQTSSFSDELDEQEQGVLIEEIVDDNIEKPKQQEEERPKIFEQKSTDSQSSFNDLPESSPSLRHNNRFFPRQQQSLEIPGHREDDDCRSTHSWRSTSRVSSRRQSTEDSIDSEDEWYCYELRKLEEMERQNQLEGDLKEEPELEAEDDQYQPNEQVREKMSFVLRELRMKAKVVEGVLDAKDNSLHVIQSAKHRDQRRSVHLEEAHLLFDKIKDIHKVDTPEEEMPPELQPEPQFIEKEELESEPETVKPEETEVEEKEPDEEHSSGETSGPDSPHVSMDEDEGEIPEEFARCHVKDKPQEETIKEQIEEKPVEEVPKEEHIPTGPGSKWKLLKALKERKAEEKCTQSKTPEPVEKEKVSMLGVMQKFYEIHVKT